MTPRQAASGVAHRGRALTIAGLCAGYGAGTSTKREGVLHGVSLEVEPGELLSILGPSGCGKTTLLRVIAGLHAAESGRVALGSHLVVDGAKGVPPERRGIGLVPQDAALFPHRTIGGNVEFGLRTRRAGPGRLDRAARRARVAEMLRLVELEDLADRYPRELSGGQRHRVALARALAPAPSLILLDEAFGALDASLRAQLRAEVREILRAANTTAVLVTHDQDEALSISDRVAIMQDGRIIQIADPEHLYTHPATAWAAQFLGECNVLAGSSDGATAACALGRLPCATPPGPVEVLVRPEHLRLAAAGAGGAEGGAGVTVVGREYLGHSTVYHLRIPDSGERLTARVGGSPEFPVGAEAEVRLDGPARAVASS